MRVPTVIVRDFGDVGVGPEWTVLGPTTAPSPAVLYPTAVSVLWSILENRSAGHAWRAWGGEWSRKDRRPTREQVEAHVSGRGWLSPFKPTRSWPYCVIDVDLHNAVQNAKYEETISTLSALFKNSLLFRSSASGGAHIYVRLPAEMAYADAAIWLTDYLCMKGLMFDKAEPGRFASVTGAVVTKLVDVPLHPPRLPFGRGSGLRGTPDPAEAVAVFENWLRATDSSDFDSARDFVMQKKPTTKHWAGRAAWATTFVHDLEIEVLRLGTSTKKLPVGDPWAPYLSRLAPKLRLLVASGCLAFGTRTATMMRIVEALAEMVEPDEARRLLRHWVEHRDHRSEDVHGSLDEVLAFGDRLIDDAFAHRGVPIQVWYSADQVITQKYAHFQMSIAMAADLSQQECRRAAFHILRLFYSARSGCIPIGGEQFGLSLKNDNYGGLPTQRPNRNRVDGVVRAMTRLGILRQTQPPRYAARQAGVYELPAPYWPPPPSGGPEVHQVT